MADIIKVEKVSEVKENKEKFIDRNPHFTIFGKGNSAISFSYIKHERDGELKWHKIACSATNNSFKDKVSIYIETEELMQLLLLLLWKQKEVKAVRNTKISGSNKSISFVIGANWSVLIKVSEQQKDANLNLSFKLSDLNKIVLYNLTTLALIKELKDFHSTNINENKLVEIIEKVIHSSVLDEVSEKEEIEQKNVSLPSEYKLTFINTVNWVNYTNTFKVKKEVYDFFKNNPEVAQNSSEEEKNILLEKIRNSDIDKESIKFLNIKNINTLKIK